MKIQYFFIISFITFQLYSCGNDKNNDVIVDDKKEAEVIDTITSKMMAEIDTTKKKHEIKEFKENLKVIEKKYGEQWGFCECVVANDSVNNALIATTNFEGTKFDKLMERSDYVTQKCQAFLSMDANKTPEERLKHEKKVKKCLKEAKNK